MHIQLTGNYAFLEYIENSNNRYIKSCYMFAFSGEQNEQNKTNTADNKKSQNWTKKHIQHPAPTWSHIIDTANHRTRREHNHPRLLRRRNNK
jgi:hypothetical protein